MIFRCRSCSEPVSSSLSTRWRIFAYLSVLPVSGEPHGATALARGIEYAADGRVATAVLEVSFGPAGAIVMAAAILVSTFGCNNGLILSGARIYYAMAKDGCFSGRSGSVNRITRPAWR